MHPLSVNSCNKAACFGESQQEDGENEGKGIFIKSVQPKLTTNSKAVKSQEDVAAFIKNRGVLLMQSKFVISEIWQQHSVTRKITLGSQLRMIFHDYLFHACFEI